MAAQQGAPLFGSWLSATRELQVDYYGRDYEALRSDPDLLGDTVQKQAGYLVWELGEMMAEYPGCKDWVTDRSAFNREAFLGEAVDVLHFFANVLTALEYTDVELSLAYEAKMQKNRDRMASGMYDGVSDKCPVCKRELDVVEFGNAGEGGYRRFYSCAQHGHQRAEWVEIT